MPQFTLKLNKVYYLYTIIHIELLTCDFVKGDVRGFGMIWFCGVMPYSWSSKWYGDGVKKVVMFGSVNVHNKI